MNCQVFVICKPPFESNQEKELFHFEAFLVENTLRKWVKKWK